MSIQYDDRLKSYYPSIVDCLWGVYLRSVQENKTEMDNAGHYQNHPFGDEYMGGIVLGRPGRLRDAQKLTDRYFGTSRPYCSAELIDGKKHYHLYQCSQGSALELWVDVQTYSPASRTFLFLSPRVLIDYRRHIHFWDRGIEDESLYVEFSQKAYELVVVASKESKRQKRVGLLQSRWDRLLKEQPDLLRTFLLEYANAPGFTLAEMEAEEADRWDRVLDEFIDSQSLAVSLFMAESEDKLFEEEI